MKNFGDRRGAIQVTGYTGSRLKVHVYEGIRELGQGLTAISPADHLYMCNLVQILQRSRLIDPI